MILGLLAIILLQVTLVEARIQNAGKQICLRAETAGRNVDISKRKITPAK